MVFNRICFLHLLPLKKFASISLLLLILLQIGGMLLVYQLQQRSVQQEMKQTLCNEPTRLEKITLSTKEYNSYKINAGEIAIDGKMYDVKSVKHSVHSVELWVINDQKEEHILQKIASFFHQNEAAPKSKFPNQLEQLFSLAYLLPENYSPRFRATVANHFYPLTLLYNTTDHLFIFTPPPELV